MKLGRIKALCKAREMVELFTRQDGRQFLSDGCGVWPVDENLKLDESVVRTIFEVTTKKWNENWHFQDIDFTMDDDAEACGLPACLLEDYYEPAAETELMPLPERALISGTEMQLYRTTTGGDKERYIWANVAQFSACPDNVRMYTLRTAPDMTRAIAVYDDVFLGGLVRLLGTGQQRAIQDTLRKLSEKEVL